MGGGAAACPQPFFLWCRMVGSDCTLPCVFCWQRSHCHPRHRAGCLTPKALPPPFRVGFVAALLSIERQHPKVIHRVSSRATWRSANARTGIRLLGLRLGFMLSYSASQRGFMIHAIHAGSSWLVATVDPSTAKPCHWSIPSSKCWRMNLAPLPFLPHTHRKETRFPSNRAGYISVFLGIGVAHDIGDVDTGFILKFSECIRKVCKATKESFFSFQTIKHSSSTYQRVCFFSVFFFSIFFNNNCADVSIFVKNKNHKKTEQTCNFCNFDRDWFSLSTGATFTKSHGVSAERRAERRVRSAPSGDIFICHWGVLRTFLREIP